MAAIVHRALSEYVRTHAGRQWPKPPAKPRKPPPAPLPSVPRRPFEAQLKCFVAAVARHAKRLDEMTAEDWPPILAEYRALKRAGKGQVSSRWMEINQKTERGRANRAALENGTPIPEVDRAERVVLRAFVIFEGIRNRWSERTPVDRDQLPPEKLKALQQGDKRRKAKSRAIKKQAADAKLYVDDGSGVVVLPSPAEEGALDAAAE